MPLKVGSARFENCAIGAALTEKSDATFGSLEASNTRIGILVQPSFQPIIPSLLEKIGLPADTPTEDIKSVLEAIVRLPQPTPERAVEIMRKSKLAGYLPAAADLATIAGLLIEAAKMFAGI